MYIRNASNVCTPISAQTWYIWEMCIFLNIWHFNHHINIYVFHSNIYIQGTELVMHLAASGVLVQSKMRNAISWWKGRRSLEVQVLIKCTSSAHQVHFKCTSSAHQVHIKCITNAHQLQWRHWGKAGPAKFERKAKLHWTLHHCWGGGAVWY